MKKSILCNISMLFIAISFGQNSKNQIEVTPYIRWDSYPKFIYAINPVNFNTAKIKGESWGINAAYKLNVHQFYIKIGLGYYRYSFNKIDQINSLFRRSNNNRMIDYYPPDSIAPAITFATDKYWYNTIPITVGIEKHIILNKGTQLLTGIDFSNYFTFSQYYHITYPAPEGTDYKKTDDRYFGFSTNAYLGIQKRFGKVNIGPTIILPIYTIWKQDKIFPEEENSKSRSKWLRSIGVGITLSKILKP